MTASGILSGTFKDMIKPRLLFVREGAKFVVPSTGEVKRREFESFEFFTHLNYQDGELCLSISDNKNCYLSVEYIFHVLF